MWYHLIISSLKTAGYHLPTKWYHILPYLPLFPPEIPELYARESNRLLYDNLELTKMNINLFGIN